LAVQLLYALGTRPTQTVENALIGFFAQYGFASEEEDEVQEYLSFLARGVWGRRVEIDNQMRRIVVGWRPERMVAVDRAVLRVAIFEGFLEKTVPIAVAISEAVEIARAFGTEDSARFVNGVLGKIARDADEGYKEEVEKEDKKNKENKEYKRNDEEKNVLEDTDEYTGNPIENPIGPTQNSPIAKNEAR
jgi:N utilization substance protein B